MSTVHTRCQKHWVHSMTSGKFTQKNCIICCKWSVFIFNASVFTLSYCLNQKYIDNIACARFHQCMRVNNFVVIESQLSISVLSLSPNLPLHHTIPHHIASYHTYTLLELYLTGATFVFIYSRSTAALICDRFACILSTECVLF